MDVPILRYVDVFIGLALVMLLGCSVIAVITQLITSAFYLRAQYLRQGLADLLQQLDPSADRTDCQYAAKLIQRHPMVSRPETLISSGVTRFRRWVKGLLSPERRAREKWMPSGSPAVVIQRQELVAILLEWAAGEGVLGTCESLSTMTAQIRAVLAANGVDSPADTLDALRYQVLAQERAFPDRPAHLWHSAAFIDACPSKLVGKIHGWYDSMSARTTQRFTLQSRWIGAAAAGFLLFFIHPIDSLDLLKRLSLDDKLRAELVEQAQLSAAVAPEQKEHQEVVENLNTATLDLKAVAPPLAVTCSNWWRLEGCEAKGTPGPSHVPGILLSWVLLSLGTPFWYDALKNALKFRTVLAQKEETDRTERLRRDEAAATTPAPANTAAAGVLAVAAQPVTEDESGDRDQLEAVG